MGLSDCVSLGGEGGFIWVIVMVCEPWLIVNVCEFVCLLVACMIMNV